MSGVFRAQRAGFFDIASTYATGNTNTKIKKIEVEESNRPLRGGRGRRRIPLWWFHDPRPLWGNNIMMLVGIDLPHRPQKGEGGNII